ncbi:MAG: hypothetical protein R3E32_00565 [Chitinophagales bacterium]
MKRQGNLIEPITSMDNLYLAYWKAKKGKQNRPEVIAFTKNLRENLRSLQSDILEQTIDFGDYHYFKIYDPKERLICATSFRERVLQHALMNVCHV